MRYYGTPWEREADFPFNFDLINMGDDFMGSDTGDINKTFISNVVNHWLFEMPEGRVANWVVGNHDNPRLASRFPNLTTQQSQDLSKMFAVLTMTLPGKIKNGFVFS